MNRSAKEQLITDIQSALDTIRPHLEVDGGDVELIDVSDDLEVKIKWLGNCQNCNMSTMTLKAGVEQAIKSVVPNVKSVIPIN